MLGVLLDKPRTTLHAYNPAEDTLSKDQIIPSKLRHFLVTHSPEMEEIRSFLPLSLPLKLSLGYNLLPCYHVNYDICTHSLINVTHSRHVMSWPSVKWHNPTMTWDHINWNLWSSPGKGPRRKGGGEGYMIDIELHKLHLYPCPVRKLIASYPVDKSEIEG